MRIVSVCMCVSMCCVINIKTTLFAKCIYHEYNYILE